MLCQSKARGNEPLISHFQTNSTTSGVNRLSKGQEPKKKKKREILYLYHTPVHLGLCFLFILP